VTRCARWLALGRESRDKTTKERGKHTYKGAAESQHQDFHSTTEIDVQPVDFLHKIRMHGSYAQLKISWPGGQHGQPELTTHTYIKTDRQTNKQETRSINVHATHITRASAAVTTASAHAHKQLTAYLESQRLLL